MKKYLSIAFAIMLLIVSCKPSVEEQIKGSWEYSQHLEDKELSSLVSGKTEFKEDGSYIDSFTVGITATPSINGEEVKMCILGQGTNEGKWSVHEGEKNELNIPYQYDVHFFSCKIYDIENNELLKDIPEYEIESSLTPSLLMMLKTYPFCRQKEIIKSIQENKMVIETKLINDKPQNIEYTRQKTSNDSDTSN